MNHAHSFKLLLKLNTDFEVMRVHQQLSANKPPYSPYPPTSPLPPSPAAQFFIGTTTVHSSPNHNARALQIRPKMPANHKSLANIDDID